MQIRMYRPEVCFVPGLHKWRAATAFIAIHLAIHLFCVAMMLKGFGGVVPVSGCMKHMHTCITSVCAQLWQSFLTLPTTSTSPLATKLLRIYPLTYLFTNL